MENRFTVESQLQMAIGIFRFTEGAKGCVSFDSIDNRPL